MPDQSIGRGDILELIGIELNHFFKLARGIRFCNPDGMSNRSGSNQFGAIHAVGKYDTECGKFFQNLIGRNGAGEYFRRSLVVNLPGDFLRAAAMQSGKFFGQVCQIDF